MKLALIAAAAVVLVVGAVLIVRGYRRESGLQLYARRRSQGANPLPFAAFGAFR